MSSIPLTLHSTAHALTDSAILIGGPGRSGTRILGSLFDSLKNTEYAFEPLMLYSLIPSIETLPCDAWKLLFETFLVEEFLFNALAGRYLNFNEHDYSNVRISKSDEEIEDRLGRTWTRNEILKTAEKRRIVVKVPDLTPFMAQIIDYFPRISLIIMLRKPESVIGSFARKQAYTDDSLSGPWSYPPYRRLDNYFLPSWISSPDAASFVNMNAIERCCYAYARGYEKIPFGENVVVIDYDDFVLRADDVFSALCRRFDREFGPKTRRVLSMVKEPVKDRRFSWDGVAPSLKERAYGAYEAMKARVWGLSLESADAPKPTNTDQP